MPGRYLGPLTNLSFLYSDDAEFSLSPAQEAIFSAWTRPRDLFPSSDDEDDAGFMTSNTTVDLVQDVTTDCSVVAGLSAAVTILTGKQAVGDASLLHDFPAIVLNPAQS